MTVLLFATFAQAQHADIELVGSPGNIQVHEPEPGEVWHSITTNPATSFQPIGGNFWYTEFPGIEADTVDNPHTLSSGATISLQLLGRLWYYHPDTHPSFGDTPGGEIIQVTKGAEDFAWTNTGVVVNNDLNNDGLLFLTLSAANGDIHTHADFTLSDGLGGLSAPADGAYLAQIAIVSSLDGTTDPVWMLWNKGLSESQFNEAIEAAETFIPEPASLALIGVGAVLLLRRRR